MDFKQTDNAIQFLSRGGEMGALIRAKDWKKTTLGDPNNWPQSLLTTLSIILNSKFPMFLWWGPDLICFYNDAYRPSLGENGKHPSILGMRAEEAWREIWVIIKPLIDQVLTKGESTWSEDQLIPIFRNGKIEDVFWTFSYSPVSDESGKPTGVLVTCNETTNKVKILKEIEEREDQLNFIINAADLGTWDLNPATNRFVGNARLKDWFALPEKEEIELQQALDCVAKKDQPRVMAAIQEALKAGSTGDYEIEYSVVNRRNFEERRVRAKGKAVFDENGVPYRFSGILQDVTEQSISQSRIEETEKRFRTVADSAPVLIWMSGPDKLCNFFNKAWLNFRGRTMEQEAGNGWADGVHPDDLSQCLNTYTTTFDDRREFYMEYRLKRYDGEFRWVSDYGVPRFGSDGVFEGYIGACMDVHDRHLSQRALAHNEEKLNVVIKASELGTWELDLDTSEVNYSDRYLQILGYPHDAVLSHAQILKHLHPEDLPMREQAFKTAYETGVLLYQSRIIWNDRSIHWIEGKGRVFFNKDGKAQKVIGTLRDITEEKNHQQLLTKSELKFRLLADSMPQHIWTADTEGNLNYFNKSVFDYTGLSKEQLDKEGWIQIIHPDDREANLLNWMNSINTGKDFLFEHRFRRHDGEYKWQLSRAIPQRNAAGKIVMWVGSSTDIQEQKTFSNELERLVQDRTEELKQKNKDLVKINAELQSFAYVSSHDLQEPLRKLQTFASRILQKEEGNLSPTGKDYFARMQMAAKRMQTLIQDLLAYSRTNTSERKFENIDLTMILEQVKDDLRDDLIQKQVIISTSPLPQIHAIPFQIRQLFTNLISNSIKFSHPGEPVRITINANIENGHDLSRESLSPKTKYCHITLSDNGIGFDAQHQDRIFEVFQRLHGRDEFAGTGIGLAIVKKIVENHNGVIRAVGVPNKGATFDLYLPVSQNIQGVGS